MPIIRKIRLINCNTRDTQPMMKVAFLIDSEDELKRDCVSAVPIANVGVSVCPTNSPNSSHQTPPVTIDGSPRATIPLSSSCTRYFVVVPPPASPAKSLAPTSGGKAPLMNISTPPKPAHICPHCQKAFPRLHFLQAHAAVHNTVSHYRCDCGATFRRAQDLRRHAKSHGHKVSSN
ncbi:hypothetical protein BC830DRAFT_1086227 [Chytriomyces sp. MP71]|nr:hypothetical protein BC830DRAFT_1086227 [Chytriomyces sp. MP71]